MGGQTPTPPPGPIGRDVPSASAGNPWDAAVAAAEAQFAKDHANDIDPSEIRQTIGYHRPTGLDEFDGKWSRLLQDTAVIFAQLFNGDVRTAPPIAIKVANEDMEKIGDMGSLVAQLSTQGAKGILDFGGWAGVAWNFYELYGLVTKGEGLGDLAAFAGEQVAKRQGIRMPLRVLGGTVAVVWTTWEAYNLGRAIRTEMAMDDIVEAKLLEVYLAFLDRVVWLPYGGYLADQRTNSGETNVSRPKGLKPGVWRRMNAIQQEIGRAMFRFKFADYGDDLPSDATTLAPAFRNDMRQIRHNKTVPTRSGLMKSWVLGRLADIDRINLDPSNWDI